MNALHIHQAVPIHPAKSCKKAVASYKKSYVLRLNKQAGWWAGEAIKMCPKTTEKKMVGRNGRQLFSFTARAKTERERERESGYGMQTFMFIHRAGVVCGRSDTEE